MSGFLRTLGMVFAWLVFISVLLGTVITLFGFANEVVDHFTANEYNTSIEGWYNESHPKPIEWWWLGAFLGGVVASTALGYMMFAGGDDEYYYCPNCHCEYCEQEHRDRDLATATAVGVSVGTTIGLGS